MAEQPPRLDCPPEVARLVPESLARRFEFCPLDYVEGCFTIAVVAFLTDDARDAVQFVLDGSVSEVVHPADEVFAALGEAYGPGASGECSAHYWRERYDIREDGSIIIKTSWYDDSSHMTGCTEVAPTHEDYPLWNWICTKGNHLPKIISGDDLDAIRAEHHRTVAQDPGTKRHDEP